MQSLESTRSQCGEWFLIQWVCYHLRAKFWIHLTLCPSSIYYYYIEIYMIVPNYISELKQLWTCVVIIINLMWIESVNLRCSVLNLISSIYESTYVSRPVLSCRDCDWLSLVRRKKAIVPSRISKSRHVRHTSSCQSEHIEFTQQSKCGTSSGWVVLLVLLVGGRLYCLL